MEAFAGHIAQFVGLIGVALVVGLAAERLRVPYSVALLVVGLAASPLAALETPFAFPSGLLFVFLPALIFDGALHLDPHALVRRWRPIVVLALPGAGLTAVLVAAGCAAFGGLAFAPAFVLGAIVSATDPVAVIATFKRLTVPIDLQSIVEAEALANDGIAVVLYTAGVAIASGGQVNWLVEAGAGLYAVAAAIAIGVACAYAYVRLLHGMSDAGYYAVGSLVLAYGSYLVADRLHASGIFACAAAGMAVPLFRRYEPSAEVLRDVENFWGALAFLANSLVFLFMGFALDLRRIAAEPLTIAVTLVIVFAARALLAYGALPLAGIGAALRPWQHVVAWSGLRGGLALALALNLPASLPGRDAIVDATFAVVLVTLVAQGLTIEPLLRRLRLPAYGGSESGGP